MQPETHDRADVHFLHMSTSRMHARQRSAVQDAHVSSEPCLSITTPNARVGILAALVPTMSALQELA